MGPEAQPCGRFEDVFEQARLLGRFAIEPRGGEPVVKQVFLLGTTGFLGWDSVALLATALAVCREGRARTLRPSSFGVARM